MNEGVAGVYRLRVKQTSDPGEVCRLLLRRLDLILKIMGSHQTFVSREDALEKGKTRDKETSVDKSEGSR